MAWQAECIFSLLFLILTFFSKLYPVSWTQDFISSSLELLYAIRIGFSRRFQWTYFHQDGIFPGFSMEYFLEVGLEEDSGTFVFFFSFPCMGVMRGGIGDFVSLFVNVWKGNQLVSDHHHQIRQESNTKHQISIFSKCFSFFIIYWALILV